ncbi:MAG: molybdate ABC transporter permease subunit [Reichenbachiella sp.]
MEGFWLPLWLSIKLATLTTLFLFLIAIPLVFLLKMYRFRGKSIIQTFIALPLVLPPSVLGYYLLIAFRPDGSTGKIWSFLFNARLAFSFEGLLIASIIFSFPFMINPIVSSLENLPKSLSEASFNLGKSKWQTFTKILLPNIKPSIISASILSFAHTIGEFGVILMIGGNIPGETRVASIALYHELEAMNYELANRYAIILLGFSFLVLLSVQLLRKKPTQEILC